MKLEFKKWIQNNTPKYMNNGTFIDLNVYEMYRIGYKFDGSAVYFRFRKKDKFPLLNDEDDFTITIETPEKFVFLEIPNWVEYKSAMGSYMGSYLFISEAKEMIMEYLSDKEDIISHNA